MPARIPPQGPVKKMDEWHNPEHLADFRRGDRKALSRVYQTHAPEVARMLSSGFSFQTGGTLIRFQGSLSPYDLQEVLQETFLRAFAESARRAFDSSRPYGPYIKQIARNVVLDIFRKKTLHQRYFVTLGRLTHEGETEEEASGRLGLTTVDDPEEQAWKAQIRNVVASFVADLGPDDRRIVDEHLAGDLSQAQIALTMGVDRNEIRRRIKAIRERLLRHLKSEGFIDELDPKLILEILMVIR